MTAIPPELLEQLRAVKQALDDVHELVRQITTKQELQMQAEANRIEKMRQSNIDEGKRTAARVVALTKMYKWENPRLTKTAIARKIARSTDAPCKYDRARQIISTYFGVEGWRNLSSSLNDCADI